MSKKIKKILIANRGEIAIRVAQTCREIGIETVCIFTKEEIELPHSSIGSDNHNLGEGSLAETYLNQELIIKLALDYGADAIHPGYGFLSENSSFAKACQKAGVIFIGPSFESIELMGDKKTSKQEMEKIGAPLIPGYHGESQEPALLKSEASKIGYPVLIKASAGGGGKGMRIVNSEPEFYEGLASAKREAANAFGNDIVLIEKFIQNPRHIEVQVFGDSKGNCVHLFERECSIQRRHQKIIEESPSPALTEKLRDAITKSAVKIAAGINYLGAGTVEFIFDEDQKFYFLEMNTRLQVEHPVTEMITGQDLVEWQIRVAEGESLPLKQEEIISRGHAIELRIYAEDPDNGFLPSIGTLNKVGEARLRGVRLDTGYIDGNEIGVSFDPMLAKLIAYGDTRERVIQKISESLNDYPFIGLKTNREYLGRVLKHPVFKKGETFTHFVETYKEDLLPTEPTHKELAMLIAASHFKAASQKSVHVERGSGVWESLKGFRNC
jgi:acetyl-CoA carboxylase biotin carboxylase subunit